MARTGWASPRAPFFSLPTVPISAIEIGWRVYLPAFFATSVGLPLAAIGTLTLAVRLFDNAIDPFVARASTTIERLAMLGPTIWRG